MTQESTEKLDKEEFIRGRLFDGQDRGWRRYSKLVIGEASMWRLFKYELITGLFGSLPGALGLALRKIVYPKLFQEVGAGVIFGRYLVIRNAQNITIGNGVFIDDYSLIDAHGLSSDGITIGDRVIINRGSVLVAKAGGLSIGTGTDIGARSSIISTGGIMIGNNVGIAGDCKIGGSVTQLDDAKTSLKDGLTKEGHGTGATEKFSKGTVSIGNNSILYMSATVLDGVKIGDRSIVGSGIILHDDVPDDSITVAHQKLVNFSRIGKPAESPTTASETDGSAMTIASGDSNSKSFTKDDDDSLTIVMDAIYSAVDELNSLRADKDKLTKSADTALHDLDSMDKVNLIVETELQLSENLGKAVSLDGQLLMSDAIDVFESIETYAERVAELV